MSINYLWLDPHRRVLEIGPQEDGSYIYFIDTFVRCKELLSPQKEIELKVQGGISLAEIPLLYEETISLKAEVLIDEEYGIAQVISIELRSKEKMNEGKLIEELKRAESSIRNFCFIA
ncbi:MAG: hypothetical protein ACP5LZ_03150 [Fervidicoccaceae archaeon]